MALPRPEDFNLITNPSDEFIRNNPVWVAELSNKETIYRHQIDGEPDSWLRLRDYLIQTNTIIFYRHQWEPVYINKLYFRFRDHFEEIGYNKPAFFFSNFIRCLIEPGARPFHSFMGGYLHENGQVLIKRFAVPELILEHEEYVDLNDQKLLDGLIFNDKITHNKCINSGGTTR